MFEFTPGMFLWLGDLSSFLKSLVCFVGAVSAVIFAFTIMIRFAEDLPLGKCFRIAKTFFSRFLIFAVLIFAFPSKNFFYVESLNTLETSKETLSEEYVEFIRKIILNDLTENE